MLRMIMVWSGWNARLRLAAAVAAALAVAASTFGSLAPAQAATISRSAQASTSAALRQPPRPQAQRTLTGASAYLPGSAREGAGGLTAGTLSEYLSGHVDPGLASVLAPYEYQPVTEIDSANQARAPNWPIYITIYNKLNNGLLEDIGVNFAAKVSDEIAKADAKALAKHVRKVVVYLQILAGILAAAAYQHPLIAAITAAVGAVMGLLAFKKWAKKFAKLVIKVKNIFKGKAAKYGAYYAFRADNGDGVASYIGMTSRSCSGNAIKCGSPGAKAWTWTKNNPDPPIHPMTDYCRSGKDCKLN